MKRILCGSLVALVSLVSLSPGLSAQGIGVAVGTLVPQGDLSNGAKSGFAGIASVQFGGRIAVRGEALWANSDLNGAIIKGAGGVPVPSSANVSGSVKLVGGLASVVWHLGIGPIQPYVLGGAGYYHRSVAQNASGAASDLSHLNRAEDKLGYHVGAGLQFSLLGLAAFGEARYHTVNTGDTKTNFIPLVVGLRF